MNIIFPSDNSLVSIISSGILATVLISTLLILKYTNIRTTGNFFSIALIIGLALSLITLKEDISALYKYVQGFYMILGVFSIGVLFAERRVIFINALIILLATTRVYSFAIEQLPESVELLRVGYINHIIAVIVITIAVVFTKTFVNEAITSAEENAKVKEEQNKKMLKLKKYKTGNC